MSRTHKYGFGKADKQPFWFTFGLTWGNSSGKGKWYKRQLAKARRQSAKEFIKEQLAEEYTRVRLNSLASKEGECSWKGW